LSDDDNATPSKSTRCLAARAPADTTSTAIDSTSRGSRILASRSCTRSTTCRADTLGRKRPISTTLGVGLAETDTASDSRTWRTVTPNPRDARAARHCSTSGSRTHATASRVEAGEER
jgi:hypothetical protein